jgi:hypothetical protein
MVSWRCVEIGLGGADILVCAAAGTDKNVCATQSKVAGTPAHCFEAPGNYSPHIRKGVLP